MTSMNDAARTLKHTSQGSRVGTNQQQTRTSQRTAQGGQGQSPIQSRQRPEQDQNLNQSRQRSQRDANLNQSRQRSQQEQNLNQSRQRSQQDANLNQSRQRSQQEQNLNQSRQRSQQDANLNQSRQRSQQEQNLSQSRQRSQPQPNLNQSRQRSQEYNNNVSRQQLSQQDPNFKQSRSQSRGDEGYQSRQRSQQVNSHADPRSRQRTQDGLGTQGRNRTAIQSPAGWSDREDPVPLGNDYQQVVTPHSRRPSQRDRVSAHPSQVSQANGSRRGGAPSSHADINDDEYEEDDEEEDEFSEEEPGVDYYPDYAPPSSVKRKGPRVETADNHETCSCFPKRKNKNIPSMLYENITCVHTGLKGQSHAGVYRFEDNWIERDVNTASDQKNSGKKGKKKAKTLNRPKIKYIYGYPKPVLPAFSDEEDEETGDDYDENDNEYMSDEEDMDIVSTRSKTQSRSKSVKSNKKPAKKRKQSRKDDSGEQQMEDDDYDDDDDEDDLQPEMTRDEVYYPVMLPQIGHSPPPSRERTRHSAKSQQALPTLPESPFIIANENKKSSVKPTHSSRSIHRTNSIAKESGRHSAPDIRSLPSPRQQKPIVKTRRFQGVYFDPVRKRTVPYDISWNGHLEQNSGKMSSRMPTRLRSSSRYSKADILEEEDDYYDEDDEYMDDR